MRSDVPHRRPEVLTSLDDKASPRHTALLVIDMLNDFIHPAGKTAAEAGRPIGHARAVLPVLARLIDAAREHGVKVIYVNHTTLPFYAGTSGPWLDARSRSTYSVEDICLEGSWGAEVVEELAPATSDVQVPKYRYSGFAGTNLDLVLRSMAVRTVVCTGVSTNACVEATAREAFSLDYYVVYASDACASWDMDLHQATLATASHRYAQVVTTDELQGVWKLSPSHP